MLHFCIEWPICRRQKMIFRRQSDARTIYLSIIYVFVQKKRISIFDFRILSRRQNAILRRQSDVRMICLSISCVFVQKKSFNFWLQNPHVDLFGEILRYSRKSKCDFQEAVTKIFVSKKFNIFIFLESTHQVLSIYKIWVFLLFVFIL